MAQSLMILIGSTKTGKSSYLTALIQRVCESDSSNGLKQHRRYRILIVDSIQNGKTTSGIHVALGEELRKRFQRNLEMPERLNRIIDQVKDRFANEVRDCITDEFSDCIPDEALNHITDEVIGKIKNQIMHARCDDQTPVPGEIEYARLTLNWETFQDALRECIDSNRIIVDTIKSNAFLCIIRSLRDSKGKCIRTAKAVSELSSDMFHGMFNLVHRWTSCISKKWARIAHTRLSLEARRKFSICPEDSFQIGMRWQDVWKTPVPALCVP